MPKSPAWLKVGRGVLTAPGCGMGTMIAADAKQKIMAIDGVGDATVDLVWDPPWNPGMIAEEAIKFNYRMIIAFGRDDRAEHPAHQMY